MNPYCLKNKVALVTGGASGIGLATCWELARQGARIAMLDMDEKALEMQRQIFSDQGYQIFAIVCDVTKEADCQSAINQTSKKFGQIDILFNNAGITQRGLFEKTDIAVFKKVMDVNFFGSLYCTKAALPNLIQTQGIIIVNESIAAVAPLLARTGYSASKHALHGLFTSLRCELRHKGVHVMIVCPGFIRTNLQTRALGSDGKIADHAQTMVGKADTPENAARQIVKGIIKKKPFLVLTFIGKLGYLVSRLSPLLYEYIMTRQFKKEL
ncbi:MAG: SDR family oxidoreductase [Deltaproteobacteria bacterium]|uniref:SDR family oxidoreductase n=1 Tax=Desulfobacula sp. TaxID=2593537 RepID=UPI0019CEDD60|nr:SDR family oxidoreductase [Candidatus Desulfobacula maris]MBL6993439.1 SDR family oxidoreductase [Desulfobacula sp.]